MKQKNRVRLPWLLALGSALGSIGLTLLAWPILASAAEAIAPAAPVMDSPIWQWGLLAAALSTGMSALAAGIAVGRVGAAAVGALAEKPELFGRLLILVGLAEGIAIYGLIVSILILNRLL
jgi:V/A-type H+-transporting ATPase subunit K